MKRLDLKLRVALIVAAVVCLAALFALLMPRVAQAEQSDGEQQISQNIDDVLEGLDLSALQQYLDENSDSFLFNFGNDASEIITYLVKGNAGGDYAGYIREVLSVVFSDAVTLLPAFAEAAFLGSSASRESA